MPVSPGPISIVKYAITNYLGYFSHYMRRGARVLSVTDSTFEVWPQMHVLEPRDEITTFERKFCVIDSYFPDEVALLFIATFKLESSGLILHLFEVVTEHTPRA